MKLATISNGTPDGELVLVSRDLQRMARVANVAPTMQKALEKWDTCEAELRRLGEVLEEGKESGEPFNAAAALAPLPRAWQWLDGSAFQSHGDLISTVFEIDKLPYEDRPLMYQGMSHRFLSGVEDVRLPSEADGIDFEGEFGILVNEVPMGTDAETAKQHIKLLVLINDWSLRAIGPIEMKTGFGWVQAKPACSVAPVAVTPDELQGHWRDGRIHLELRVIWNGQPFGHPNGGAMAFGFHDLVAHAARTRDLVAGTIIGSGTVSNFNFREVGSSCIAERRAIEILDDGRSVTEFMQFGDHIEIEAFFPAGDSVFGSISQQIVRA
jgi:fumarylacetoacetate (FAA) hydrolase